MDVNVSDVEAVSAVLSLAKVNEGDILPQSQRLSFSTSLADNYRLLEVDDNLLKYLESGNALIIRGRTDDVAVACTDCATFEIKEVDTSNSMLLLPECTLPNDIMRTSTRHVTHREVAGVFKSYLELRPIGGRTKRIAELLLPSRFSGNENEYKVANAKKYTFSDLLNEVQASEAEILQCLETMHVVKIQDAYRLLDFDYLTTVFSQILNFVAENSWSWKSVSLRETVDVLSELEPSCVIERCLHIFAESADEATVCLSERKVARFYAEVLLKPVVGKFCLEDFLEAWQESLPEDMNASLEQLKGLAFIDNNSFPKSIQYFPAADLPDLPQERFDLLFKKKPSWSFDEIAAYVEDLTSAKLDVGVLLAKYARCSTSANGEKQYSTKKPL